jgi:hypothetical protein
VFLVYLLWITVVFGGLFMGLGAVLTMARHGFDMALAINAILYLGCALYGGPKLFKLLFKRG